MLKEFYEKHKNALFILGVVIVTYFLYFHNLGNFKLLDVDETRYVDMSRCMRETGDYMTLFLNGEYFFEKPPLFFWLENISFAVFNAVNEFTARVPGCIEGIFAAIVLFFTTKKFTKNTKWAALSALVLLCSAEFLILSKTAILDILLCSMVTISVLCGFMTFAAEEKQKKFYWWGFYLFSALGVLGKGIPAIVVPFGIMFIAGLYTKKFKEYFRPQYFLVGLAMFFAVVIPWHKLMLSMYDPLFFDEYIIKHHFARFLGADVINRDRPFLFYVPVILWGILPFMASFIALLAEKTANFCKGFSGFKNIKLPVFDEMDKEGQFVALSVIGTLVTFLFFSVSGTKLITYIIPIYPYLAVLLAKYWLEYIDNVEHKKGIEISSMIFYYLLIIAGIGFVIAIQFIPEPIKGDLLTIVTPITVATIVFPVIGIVAIKKENRKLLFASYVLFMAVLSGFAYHKILEMDYRFGQNDLIEYAQYAKENNLNINTFETGRRYSLLYYSGKNVVFDIPEEDFAHVISEPQNIIIVRKKELGEVPVKATVLKEGRKYVLLTK